MNKNLDPVTLEVIRNSLPSISNEMSADLQRSSYNMMVYEVRDYCCALIDKKGQLLSQNLGGVSHFVADLGVIIEDGMQKFGDEGFKPGDVIITNHQAVAGQHLNNIVIYSPFFYKDELICFAMVRAHWMDVGGLSTGFGAASKVKDPWMEGLQLDQIKIHEEGEMNYSVLKMIKDNIRFPESSLGDMRAQIATCNLAHRRLNDLFSRYGRDIVMQSIDVIFEETEEKCRQIVADIHDGVYEAESLMDNDGHQLDDPIRIHAKVTVSGEEMTIDLSGCSQQREGAVNSRTYAAGVVAYKAITAPLDPVNEGSFKALDVVIPEGNIMMAKFPAPMSNWSMILPTVVDTVLKALSTAVPDKIPAAHAGVLGGNLVCQGKDPRTNKSFVLQSIEGAGWGGRPHEDGEDASVSVCQGDVRNAPIESIEIKAPVLVKERRLRTDSGGAGRSRGGLGLDLKIKSLVDLTWDLFHSRRSQCLPWGLNNGKEGKEADYLLKTPEQDEFTSVDVVRHPVKAGSEVIIRTSGGGGWGNPLERDPKVVRWDVIEGIISRESAQKDYGVILNDDDTVDVKATATLREELNKTLQHV